MLAFGARAVGTGVTGGGASTGATGTEGAGGAGFGGCATTTLGLTSGTGALQTLDPKAGMEAGGDEARGAYLSLDASARLAKSASSLPGSRRSLADRGSTARDERREYESTWGPSRSDGDG